jgi:integrase
MTTSKYTTSDYLTPEEINKLIRYFKRLGNHQMELLIEFGVKTLLRYSDLSRVKWEDVLDRETLVLNEKKTNKRREITLGRCIRERIEMVHNQLGNPNNEEFIFTKGRWEGCKNQK